jgi:hypothetical protein
MGIAEEHYYYLPPEIRQTARLTIKIGKVKISLLKLLSDIHSMIRRQLTRPTGCKQQYAQYQE